MSLIWQAFSYSALVWMDLIPDLDEVKKSGDLQRVERLNLNYIFPDTRLRLCGDACQQMMERE